ncbi:type I pantothenate kinase [Notoacmeibacter ruber]|uniref:Pantothenate kinase n=1 Tax=Notoacmeibacter ruber TaxID=2670375 RepID=A0A3L7JFU3_9HYPH|nr:type I pantothenate kinase [Notoacmeibacter ruber]RLQ89169.1 type I pantothenate kinase [Notoacmeibacter ruber]
MTLQTGGEAGYHLGPTGGQASDVSPYRTFSAQQWSAFRADTPLTLAEDEVQRLRSLGDPVDLDEVCRIYLSLSRLLSAHVEATQLLFAQRAAFLNAPEAVKTPFIIGIAGSVAVGKSTTARVLKELLARWPSSPKVDLVTTDGFLMSNARLEEEGLMDRKGFPESYDVASVLRFLSAIKSGERRVRAPVYSHVTYDVVPDDYVEIETPDILIFEGINVLQTRDLPSEGRIVPFVSDFFDFSIYIDADEALIRTWYIDRFMDLRHTAFRDPESYFHRYSQLSEGEARHKAETLWQTINRRNLVENILPTRPRADLILRKGADHLVESVSLRKL